MNNQMSMMEEFLELQEKMEKLQKELKEKTEVLDERDDKLINLQERINTLTNTAVKGEGDTKRFRSMTKMLEESKADLEKERDRLVEENGRSDTQLKQLANAVETTNRTLQTKEELLLSKEKQLQSKDTVLMEKEEKLEALRVRVEDIFTEKVEFIEKYSNESSAQLEKIGTLEKDVIEKTESFKKMKKKFRTAQEGLMGTSMELDSLKKKLATVSESSLEQEKIEAELLALKEKYEGEGSGSAVANESGIEQYKQEIEALKTKLASGGSGAAVSGAGSDIFSSSTGTYSNISSLISHFKLKLDNVKRTLRIIVPDIKDLGKHGLLEVLQRIPNRVLKNIACSVNPAEDSMTVRSLKELLYKVTDFRGNLFAFAIDDTDAALAVFDPATGDITGMFCQNPELVKLLGQAIMNPFIKGIKI